jgi:hypothetical protein
MTGADRAARQETTMPCSRRAFLVTAVAAAALPAVPFPITPARAVGPQTPNKQDKPKKPKTPPGGANQVQGMAGKVGDMLFDGRWRFQVQDVQLVDTYTLKVPSSQQDYSRFREVANEEMATHRYTPKEGYAFVAVRCLVKNGQKTVQQLECYPPDLKTAIADTEGNSHPPIVYDMLSQGAWNTKPMLPGSGQTMTVLFAVPKGTTPKDLVFSLKNFSDRKVNNLRISLPPLAPPAAPPPSAPAATPPAIP